MLFRVRIFSGFPFPGENMVYIASTLRYSDGIKKTTYVRTRMTSQGIQRLLQVVRSMCIK